jgi:hypothetical protein
MQKLVLTFGSSVLKEMFVDRSGVGIGRSPDNALVIDNRAVSHHHARVFMGAEGRLMLEDFGSLNGTFVNGRRAKLVSLNPGDRVTIGKHAIMVEDSREMDGFALVKDPPRPAAPKVAETMILGTNERSQLLQRVAEDGERSQIAPARLKVPTLLVRKGKTNQREYSLLGALTVIGKSPMATIRLRGWFAPRTAAQINRREDNSYYIGAAAKVPSINGHLAGRPTRLLPGDIIEVAGVELEFQYRD